MMDDNVENGISYWLLFQEFHSPVLAVFAVISHWTPYLLANRVASFLFRGLRAKFIFLQRLIAIKELLLLGLHYA
jgi:hypothetical protein